MAPKPSVHPPWRFGGGVTEPRGLPQLLTAEEAAGLLRTSRRAVYSMSQRDQLPGALRIGRRLLVRRDELLQALGLGPEATP